MVKDTLTYQNKNLILAS